LAKTSRFLENKGKSLPRANEITRIISSSDFEQHGRIRVITDDGLRTSETSETFLSAACHKVSKISRCFVSEIMHVSNTSDQYEASFKLGFFLQGKNNKGRRRGRARVCGCG
jgi:hypothetical protein